MPATITIEAKNFLDPNGGIVQSASLLADEVIRQLKQTDVVRIDFRDVRGLTSSYFNVLLQRVLAETTQQAFSQRIQLHFDSIAQQQVFDRSMESVRRSVA